MCARFTQKDSRPHTPSWPVPSSMPKPSKNPSLYALVGKLDKLLYALDGNPRVKDILLKQMSPLKALYCQIEGGIAARELSEVDKALYQIEDIFEEIEYDLAGL